MATKTASANVGTTRVNAENIRETEMSTLPQEPEVKLVHYCQ